MLIICFISEDTKSYFLPGVADSVIENHLTYPLSQRSHAAELLFEVFREKKKHIPQQGIDCPWHHILFFHRSLKVFQGKLIIEKERGT